MGIKKDWGASTADVHNWMVYYLEKGEEHPDLVKRRAERKARHERAVQEATAARRADIMVAARIAAEEEEQKKQEQEAARERALKESKRNKRISKLDAWHKAAQDKKRAERNYKTYRTMLGRLYEQSEFQFANSDVVTLQDVSYDRLMIGAGREFKSMFGVQVPIIDIGWARVTTDEHGRPLKDKTGMKHKYDRAGIRDKVTIGDTLMFPDLDSNGNRAILVSNDPQRLQEIRTRLLELHKISPGLAPEASCCLEFPPMDESGYIQPAQALVITGLIHMNADFIRQHRISKDPVFGPMLLNIIGTRDLPRIPMAESDKVKLGLKPAYDVPEPAAKIITLKI